MDRDTKTLLASIGIGLIILWIFKPKKTSSENKPKTIVDKYQEPKVVAEDDKKIKDDAVVALQAVRDAINNRESSKEIDKLKNMILQETSVKVMINKKTNKLTAMRKDGSIIAEEE